MQERPLQFELHQNRPNPFNPRTTVAFSVVSAQHLRISVYDMAGRLVETLVNDVRQPGRHEVIWDGTDSDGRPVAAGTYLVRLETEGAVATKKTMLVR